MIKHITNKWLKNQAACSEGQIWFCSQKEYDALKILQKLIAEKRLTWADWLIVRIMDKRQKIQYAVFAAEQVIDIFEKKYPDDDRPRKAIETAKAYLLNPSKKNKNAADAAYAAVNVAAYAADAAANAAAYAVYAAYAAADAAANVAAYAAANAAYAAANSAYAADAAANAAAEMKIKILNFGLELLK